MSLGEVSVEKQQKRRKDSEKKARQEREIEQAEDRDSETLAKYFVVKQIWHNCLRR